MKRQASGITVVQDPEQAVEPEVLATAIVRISEGMDKVLGAGLTRRAICVLVKDMTNVPIGTTEMVLDALSLLKKKYIQPTRERR